VKDTRHRRRIGDLDPDPELWSALGEGGKLAEILRDFYGRVYEDSRLAPFFKGVTIGRAIEKQYSFLSEKLTGNKLYFGYRPRNAHHWMVISDELFTHREELLESCMRRAGLAEPMVERWRALDEVFRKQIVKSKPYPLKLRGQALPLDGYEALDTVVGSLCDGCEGEIPPRVRAEYHVRTGKLYCHECMPSRRGG
jgi:truncated hemoglobin YjbI